MVFKSDRLAFWLFLFDYFIVLIIVSRMKVSLGIVVDATIFVMICNANFVFCDFNEYFISLIQSLEQNPFW